MRRNVIQIAAAAAILLAAGGCTPEQRQQADATGDTIAQESRELAQGVRIEAADAALTGKVKAALELRQGLEEKRIEVKANAREGEVTLEGSVPDMQQRRLAEEVVSQTEGVKRVVNNLAVPPDTVTANPPPAPGTAARE